ncbi:hypothetical protein RR46_08409 [Papilio xuthus]|uniref:Uncharacterized protein n=1 Tax=Papilio xuthus TaxID=66420 RepID=A0A194PG28_PAPXU|nr:hypothetical protein RR46_08409 [Papilio xuthus]
MERVLWGEGGPPPLLENTASPLRDIAAPVPQQIMQDGGSLPSVTELSQASPLPLDSIGSDHQSVNGAHRNLGYVSPRRVHRDGRGPPRRSRIALRQLSEGCASGSDVGDCH